MRVRVHRGTKEISGTCIELEGEGARILLDLGLPLDGDPDEATTSGHTSIVDPKRLAKAIAPKMLVPIHAYEPQNFPEHFKAVSRKSDGEWWEVAA